MTQTEIEAIYDILGEQKLREETLTKMIHKQGEEIEQLRRNLQRHRENLDAHKE